MNLAGYTNPMRSLERRLAPDYASREFRDPGLRSTGLGSLHRTMPHLRRLEAGAPHFQGGGAATSDPVGRFYAASRPNYFNPGAERLRQLHDAIAATPLINPELRQLPRPIYPYQEGGEVEPDPKEMMNPEDEQTGRDDEMRQIVLEALAALEGRHPDAEGALKRFVDAFGPRALADLQQMAEDEHRRRQEDEGGAEEESEGEQEQQPEEGDEEDNPLDELSEAGGGLLEGPGTGQSDEIEGATPSGRPVLLSDGEYVIDAPTVAALGDGSTSAGARRLDELRRQIRRDAYGHEKQAKPMSKGGKALMLRLP
jgi:hypothetical protein